MNIDVDGFGTIAKVAKDCIVELTGTPVGAIANFSGHFLHAIHDRRERVRRDRRAVDRADGDGRAAGDLVARGNHEVPRHPLKRHQGDDLEGRLTSGADGVDLHTHVIDGVESDCLGLAVQRCDVQPGPGAPGATHRRLGLGLALQCDACPGWVRCRGRRQTREPGSG